MATWRLCFKTAGLGGGGGGGGGLSLEGLTVSYSIKIPVAVSGVQVLKIHPFGFPGLSGNKDCAVG